MIKLRIASLALATLMVVGFGSSAMAGCGGRLFGRHNGCGGASECGGASDCGGRVGLLARLHAKRAAKGCDGAAADCCGTEPAPSCGGDSCGGKSCGGGLLARHRARKAARRACGEAASCCAPAPAACGCDVAPASGCGCESTAAPACGCDSGMVEGTVIMSAAPCSNCGTAVDSGVITTTPSVPPAPAAAPAAPASPSDATPPSA